nr:MAG TPA: hypothetical protein [Caudoviricetes sp.]
MARKHTFHREKCCSKVRAIIKDTHENKIILIGQHAFEWSIVKEADGKIVITSFPNRILAQQEFNKLKI